MVINCSEKVSKRLYKENMSSLLHHRIFGCGKLKEEENGAEHFTFFASVSLFGMNSFKVC